MVGATTLAAAFDSSADGRIALSWTEATGATAYRLQVKTGSGEYADHFTGAGTSTVYNDTAGTAYTFETQITQDENMIFDTLLTVRRCASARRRRTVG